MQLQRLIKLITIVMLTLAGEQQALAQKHPSAQPPQVAPPSPPAYLNTKVHGPNGEDADLMLPMPAPPVFEQGTAGTMHDFHDASRPPPPSGFIQGPSKSSEFIRAERRDGKEVISFSVRQVSLLSVLKPLADMLGSNSHVKFVQISADPNGGLPEPDPFINSYGGNRAEVASPPPGANSSTRSKAAENLPKRTLPAKLPATAPVTEPPRKRVKTISVGGDDFDVEVSAQLEINDDSARTRLVSAKANELTLADALAVLAKAAHCSIVRKGDKIVVDQCD